MKHNLTNFNVTGIKLMMIQYVQQAEDVETKFSYDITKSYCSDLRW